MTKVRIPICHPERKHRARGLCCQCYYKSRRAQCHPNRTPFIGKLCSSCYYALPENKERYEVVKKRIAEQNRSRYYSRIRRNSFLKKRYGICIEEYELMLKSQGGLCFLCQRPPNTKRGLEVDHSHLTGKTRKLLCPRCNSGLSILENPPIKNWLELALNYIKP